ncbi:beta-ketoacyl synthase N-terminal-like domain-containing protein [Pseudomonas sp. GV071]|uniref:beta-ketoacyl synthase N-terminal-like domain-containing protein n=1 Tax=Pseudomonas sp. GV071 TaxID=2135754 RepID=UPI000D37D64E|nr:beta-ketoacyl synthase N-terminal-like domain-containing protein [Pseudomonas sp. GV071]PTQ71161.1 3-oxoacyl-[acyl-carrier-protein] synthase-1 [Pseudomonas sp. GV071]
MTPVYLQRGALQCALSNDLVGASQAMAGGQRAEGRPFALHELRQPRTYLNVPGDDVSLDQRLDAVVAEALGADHGALSDCLLIVASTSLDITALETLAGDQGQFLPSDSTPLDLEAEQLRSRWGFADAFTLNTACTSAANGLLYGARLLASGPFARAVVLAFETPSALAMQGFGALDLLSPSGHYRPFHPERDGLVLGETYAAALLSLEPGDAPLARLLGGFSACDTSSLTTTREDGSHINWVMRQALKSAQRDADDVALVKLHGTATQANDHAERNGMLSLYGEKMPALCVLKPWLGHTLGACGLSETLLLMQALQQQQLPGLDYAAEASLPLSGEPVVLNENAVLLANFFGFGGNNASLVLQCVGGAS